MCRGGRLGTAGAWRPPRESLAGEVLAKGLAGCRAAGAGAEAGSWPAAASRPLPGSPFAGVTWGGPAGCGPPRIRGCRVWLGRHPPTPCLPPRWPSPQPRQPGTGTEEVRGCRPRGLWLPKSFGFWLLSGGGGGCHFQRGWQGRGLSPCSPSSWVLRGAGGLGQGVPRTSGTGGTWSHPEWVQSPAGGLPAPGETPGWAVGGHNTLGRQPVGSRLLRGVPSQGHAAWPRNPFGPICPCHQAPSLVPRCCQGGAEWERVLPPPQKLPCGALGLASWAEGTLRGQGPILAPSRRWWVLPAGQTGHYWEHGAKPRLSPQGVLLTAPQELLRLGGPRSPDPPIASLSLDPSRALGDAGGHWCCQSPAHSTPGVPRSPPARGWPMGATTSGGSGVPVGAGHGPLSTGLLQRHGVPGGPGMGDAAGAPQVLPPDPRQHPERCPAPPAPPRAALAPLRASSLGTGAPVHTRG